MAKDKGRTTMNEARNAKTCFACGKSLSGPIYGHLLLPGVETCSDQCLDVSLRQERGVTLEELRTAAATGANQR